MNKKIYKTHDVIIVGAGLVGLVLAAFLIKQGLRVALIEMGKVGPQELKPNEFQLRVSAINSSCKQMFSDLGVWQNVVASKRLSAFEKMFVWDSVGRGEIHFDSTEVGESCLGYILENAVLHNALLKEIEKNPNISIFQNCLPLNLSKTQSEIKLHFKRNDHPSSPVEIISAELLVGADGANSWVRQEANIETYTWPYNHQALVTTVECELPHQKTAWQCFLPDGPLALLPLHPSNVCSIVWSATPDEIKRLNALDEKNFNTEITHAFENRLGNLRKISDQFTVPLFMRHAKKYINDRVALVGDAAHTIHPLAGQGINLGFADAWSLAKLIIETKQNNKDCGEYVHLRQYERNRKSDNWVMILGMEFFKRLFQSESSSLIHMRSLGLKTANKMGLIKEQFIYQAMGR